MTTAPDSRLTDERLQTLIDFVPTWVGGKWDREDMLDALRELQQARLSATASEKLLNDALNILEQYDSPILVGCDWHKELRATLAKETTK